MTFASDTSGGFAFVEQLDGESDADLMSAIEAAIKRVYGERPDWLEYQIGGTRRLRGCTFREFMCPAGSVVAQFIMHAEEPTGLGRRLLCFGEEDGIGKVFVYGPSGAEEFSPDEVE